MSELPLQGYLFLLLSAACSLGIGVIFKVAAVKSIDSSFLIGTNYVVASIVGLVIAGRDFGIAATDPVLLLVSSATGVLFIGGFYAMAYATRVAGVALTLSSWRMSVILPFMASWLVWSEVPSAWQLVGLALAVVAFLLISNAGAGLEGQNRKSIGALLLVFGLGGTVDTILKFINESLQIDTDSMVVTCLIFGTAAVVMSFVLSIRKLKGAAIDPRSALAPGAILGLLNLGTIIFLLEALQSLPGTVVFPAVNVSIVVGAALVGTLIWDEELSRAARLGVLVAIGALLLLTIGS
ncbi:MAG: DMT family transporter [Rhodothermales bacterium]|nr:DMT family transporter [Rhodothermales bacterium]